MRKILAADDVYTNRAILRRILEQEYEVLEAADGEEAVEIMRREGAGLSLLLLDLDMPKLNGYEVLSIMRADPVLSAIPVIVATGVTESSAEVRALSMGANDFVMKPYSSMVIRHRVANTVRLRETSAAINALERDSLTGLFSREVFFARAGSMIHTREPGYYVMTCFDVDRFKVINDQYGTRMGDAVLKHIAAVIRRGFEGIDSLCCRISADTFAVLYPIKYMDSEAFAKIRYDIAHMDGLIAPLMFSIGRYVVDDATLPPQAMYERASMAVESIKGRYDQKTIMYDESMRQRLLRNQEIVLQMERALRERQFEVWFQPQYNHATRAMIGAEALVRWRHPERGMISPGEFIPLFEENGFIYELDQFVWNEVCRYLRAWLDEGADPLPISVNISRYDILRPDLVQTLMASVRQYALPIGLLRLEITESAFSQTPEQIIRVVRELIGLGFTVEIDDFGSGYSSLNTLKDVPAQVLKLDMRFLESRYNSQRGGNVVESVVRMAKWIDMSVIAEGVETLEQADFLKSIGCNYIQGYLYAKPMPADQYAAHRKGNEREEKLLALETVVSLDSNAFWDPASMDTLIFNSYVGGACLYEFNNGAIELIRATDKFAQLLGGADMTVEKALRLDWSKHLDEENKRRLFEAMEQSIAAKNEVTGEYLFLDLPGCPRETCLRVTLRVVAIAGSRRLAYCANENITAQRQAERRERAVAQELRALSERMQTIMDNIDLGVMAVATDEAGAAYIVFANDRYYKMLGYTKAQFKAEVSSPYQPVDPRDTDRIKEELRRTELGKDSVMMEYRVLTRSGQRRWQRATIVLREGLGFDRPVQFSAIRDVTEEKEAQRRERRINEQMQAIMRDMHSGITAITFTHGIVNMVFANDRFYEMRGHTKATYRAEVINFYTTVHPDDRDDVRQGFLDAYASEAPAQLEYRLIRRDGRQRWIRIDFSSTRFTDIDQNVLLCIYTDITEQKHTEQTVIENADKLRISEDESALALRLSDSMIGRFMVRERTLALPSNVAAAYALPSVIRNMPEEPIRLGIISPLSADVCRAFFEAIIRGDAEASAVFQLRRLSQWRWAEVKSGTIFTADGQPLKAVIAFRDVTERVEKEAVYRKWQQSIQGRTPDSYVLYKCSLNHTALPGTTEGRLIHFDFNAAGEHFNQRMRAYAGQCVLEEDRDRLLAFVSADAMLAEYYRGHRADAIEYREMLEDGGCRWLRLSVDLVEHPNTGDTEAYLMFENIDEAKRVELETQMLAQTDSLTGLLNRVTFAARVNEILAASKRDACHALMMLDVDGFKLVNDAFGHAAGDQALVDIADHLRGMVRRNDLTTRLGGDEYMIFLRDIPDEHTAAMKAKQLCAACRKAFSMEVQISASVGIVLAPRDGADFDSLYRKADSALYYVKGSGKDNYAFYSAQMQYEHLSLEQDADDALKTPKAEKKRRMLIVDDDIITQEILHNLFKDEFIIEKARNGASALIRLRHYGSAISVVLLDLVMPGMDGFEVLQKIRQSDETRAIPVLVVSGDENRDTSLKAIRGGATDYISKPVDADTLRIRVHAAVSKAENERLRAKNSLLELQSEEHRVMEAAFDSAGLSIVVYDWLKGRFTYSPDISRHLLGVYDKRAFWHILLADMVADTPTVQRMQRYVHAIAEDRGTAGGSMVVRLNTPGKTAHRFRVNVRKLTTDLGLTGKLIITLNDLDYEVSS